LESFSNVMNGWISRGIYTTAFLGTFWTGFGGGFYSGLSVQVENYIPKPSEETVETSPRAPNFKNIDNIEVIFEVRDNPDRPWRLDRKGIVNRVDVTNGIAYGRNNQGKECRGYLQNAEGPEVVSK